MLLPNRQTGKSTPLIIIIAAIALLVGLMSRQPSTVEATVPQFEKITLLPKTKSLGEVKFTDHYGNDFSQEHLKGKWSILFFAFTNCPDVCPSTLHTLKQVKQKLGTAWPPLQLLMITVDPERDSSERLKQYVPFFDPEFIGLRANLDYTTAFAKNVGVLFFKGKTLEGGGYDVDHSAYMILVNPQGEYAGVISAPHTQETLYSDLKKLSDYAKKSSNRDNATANSGAAQPPALADQDLNSDQSSSDSSNGSSGNSDGKIVIKDAWIRPAPPSAPAMAGYLSIENQRDQAISIVNAQSPLFDEIMIHQTKIEDGVAGMNHLMALEIKAGETALLEPIGTHLMMMDPDSIPSAGTQVPVTLSLANGERININIEVRNNPNAD